MYRLLTVFLVFLLMGCDQQLEDASVASPVSVDQRMGGSPDPGFKRALEARPFSFPADHGAHPEYATEWWYFTGNLSSEEGRPFGYQLTLFRVGLVPGEAVEDSDWRTHQVYMGHLAISDIEDRRHLSEERFNRAAAGLAGVKTSPIRVWLGPWSIDATQETFFPLRLNAQAEGFAINLSVSRGNRPVVLQGDRGLSQKGAEPGNASYYYSYTRLPTQGSISIEGQQFDVEGLSWFDREWSSSALSSDQEGWDWFALQLEDGRDLMFYRLRGKNGEAQRFSRGVLVEPDGVVHELSLNNTLAEPMRSWESEDGAAYPVEWSLKSKEHNLDLIVTAAFNHQEMRHTVHYWEGAVLVSGSHKGKGYLELSGYAR
jgi:predicted secreted hydrolase